MVGLVLGLQGGYTKYPCFLCFKNSMADKQHCQTRVAFKTMVKISYYILSTVKTSLACDINHLFIDNEVFISIAMYPQQFN